MNSGWYFSLNLISCSNVYAAFSIVSSSNLFPINCIPIGIPFLSTPQGSDIPGSPAIFTGTVFGFYPALKASKLVPVEALNEE